MEPGPRRTARAFVRDDRGGAGIEFALGAAVVLAVAAMGFDLYGRIEAGAAGARMAAGMADYVSRETAPERSQMSALGEYLLEHGTGGASDAVYRVSLIRRPAGTPPGEPRVEWVDTIRVSGGDEDTDAAAADSLAGNCGTFGDEGANASLPDGFAMAPGDVIVAAEVCARLREMGTITRLFEAGDIYGVHVVPARQPSTPPARPV